MGHSRPKDRVSRNIAAKQRLESVVERYLVRGGGPISGLMKAMGGYVLGTMAIPEQSMNTLSLSSNGVGGYSWY